MNVIPLSSLRDHANLRCRDQRLQSGVKEEEMRQRKYSVAEIDQMRRALGNMYGSGSYRASERSAEVEDRLRTHMQNGTSPDELSEAAAEHTKQQWEAHQAAQEFFSKDRQTAKR